MARLPSLPRALRWVVIVALVLLVGGIVVPLLLAPWLGGRVHAFARSRGLEASWKRLAFEWPATVVLRGIALRHAGTGTLVFRADRAEATLAPRLGSLKPRVVRLELGGSLIALPAETDGASEASAVVEATVRSRVGPAAPRVRAAAEQL